MSTSSLKLPTNFPLLLLEALAVVLGAAFTALIAYGNPWCWPAAVVSSTLFIYLCYGKRIYAEAFLHLFYLATGIYGWITFDDVATSGYQSYNWQTHLAIIAAGVVGCFVLAFLLRRFTNAFWPGVDTFTTVFGIIATILMLQAVVENWYYLIVIDVVSIALYASRRMYLTAVLFIAYTILAINAVMEWSQAM